MATANTLRFHHQVNKDVKDIIYLVRLTEIYDANIAVGCFVPSISSSRFQERCKVKLKRILERYDIS